MPLSAIRTILIVVLLLLSSSTHRRLATTSVLLARACRSRTLQRGKKPSWKCNVLLSALPPRASPYAPIFPRGDGLGNPMHIVPPIGAAIPCVACMGERDQYFKYGQQGLKSIYGPSLKWFEHTGGHETAKDPEVNGRLADAIWRAVGFEPPSRAEWAKAQVPRS